MWVGAERAVRRVAAVGGVDVERVLEGGDLGDQRVGGEFCVGSIAPSNTMDRTLPGNISA